MDSKKFKKIWAIAVFAAGLSIAMPANAFGKKDEIIVPENFPAKYTKEVIQRIAPEYKQVSEDYIFYVALDMLKGTNGEFSRRAILGNNLSGKPVRVMFKDLSTIKPEYASLTRLDGRKAKRFIFS